MESILHDDEELHITTAGQDWIVTWHAPTNPPSGTPHGAAGLCITSDGGIVLISADGTNWDFPAGRPEDGETWEDTLRREMREEACAEIVEARLLGFARSQCMAGHEKGKILVRSFWRAEVTLSEWKPEWEITHRHVVPVRAVLLYVPPVYLPVSRRALREAGLLLSSAP